jgi:hypothetical protein
MNIFKPKRQRNKNRKIFNYHQKVFLNDGYEVYFFSNYPLEPEKTTYLARQIVNEYLSDFEFDRINRSIRANLIDTVDVDFLVGGNRFWVFLEF